MPLSTVEICFVFMMLAGILTEMKVATDMIAIMKQISANGMRVLIGISFSWAKSEEIS